MQSPPSKNNKIILASIANKSSTKRQDLLNTSSKRAQSNERRLQTLEPETTIVATPSGNGVYSNNVFGKQLFQSPTSAMGQSNNQKRKLFSNLNNCTPKSPANIYATITTSNTTTSAATNNTSSSRHSKITKLNNFFEQRKNNGAESAKKSRITNENILENLNRQKFQNNNEMEEEISPHNYQQQQQYNHGQNGALSSNHQYLELMNRNENIEAEFNKTIKEFRKQIKQNQVNQLANQSKDQKLTFPPVPDSVTFPSTPIPNTQDNHEVINNHTPIDKPQNSQPQNSGLNSFVTRINKGEMVGGVRQSQNNNGGNNYISNLGMNSPSNNTTAHLFNNNQQNQGSLFYQHQNQQYLSSLVPINNQIQSSNNSHNLNVTKLLSSNEKKTNKEVLLMMNNKFKKADSFKLSRAKQEQSSSQTHQEAVVSGGSVRSSLQKPFSKKSGRQTMSSVRTSSSMKQKSKKPTPLQISLDHSLNQQILNQSTQNQQVQSYQHSRQHTNITSDNMAIDIEEQSQIPQENAISTLPPNLRINLDEIFLHKQKNPIKHSHYYNIPMTNALKNKTSTDQYFEQLFKEHFIQSFHSLNFCKNIKPVSHHILQSKKLNLPIHTHNQGKKTVVFDLDETLIHCNENTDIPADVIIPIKFPNNEVIDAGINIRPHAKECLEELSKYFEIIVFTASHGCYAVKVLQQLDPEEKYISHRLFRESCIQTEEGVHIKDMRIFQNRNIKDIVLVDNAAYSFGFQIENGIPIVPYYDNKNDQELKHLTEYLLNNILECQDVREINKQYFKMHLHQNSDKLEHAAKRIYNI